MAYPSDRYLLDVRRMDDENQNRNNARIRRDLEHQVACGRMSAEEAEWLRGIFFEGVWRPTPAQTAVGMVVEELAAEGVVATSSTTAEAVVEELPPQKKEFYGKEFYELTVQPEPLLALPSHSVWFFTPEGNGYAYERVAGTDLEVEEVEGPPLKPEAKGVGEWVRRIRVTRSGVPQPAGTVIVCRERHVAAVLPLVVRLSCKEMLAAVDAAPQDEPALVREILRLAGFKNVLAGVTRTLVAAGLFQPGVEPLRGRELTTSHGSSPRPMEPPVIRPRRRRHLP